MLTTFFFLKRLTVPAVDQFIADLKDSVKEAKIAPSGNGTMVSLYGMLKGILFGFNSIFFVGLGRSSAVGPELVGEIATAFLDALYKA